MKEISLRGDGREEGTGSARGCLSSASQCRLARRSWRGRGGDDLVNTERPPHRLLLDVQLLELIRSSGGSRGGEVWRGDEGCGGS